MVKIVNIDDISPAPYNPRRITDEQIETLKRSINEVGFIIPILINKKNNVIIAGHQRTKAARACGIESVPAFYVDDISLGDEIKFNQMHNAIGRTINALPKLLKQHDKEKFIQIDHNDFEKKKALATSTKEICRLILKYGNVLSCVVCKNDVVYGCEYVKACKLLDLPVNTYICYDSKYNQVTDFLNQEYGKFSYDGIKRDSYVQGLAQIHRLSKTGKQNKSALYETLVLPYLKTRGGRREYNYIRLWLWKRKLHHQTQIKI